MSKYLIHHVDCKKGLISVYEYSATRSMTVKQSWKYIAINDFTKYELILNIKMESRLSDLNESDYKKVIYITTL